LSDLIENNKKNTKVILANKVSVGNALIRKCNLIDGVSSFNMITKTPLDIAKEIMNAVSDKPVDFISPEASVYIMMNVLNAQNSSLFSPDSLTPGTAGEVLLRINEIRENGVTEAYEDEVAKNSGRLRELDLILKAYEQVLSDNNIYDKCRLLREATSCCRKNGEDVITAVPFLKGAVYGDLSTNRWTTVEKEFMDVIISATASFGSRSETIDFLEEEITIPMSFYKARGITNEIRYAVGKMKEIAKKESYGTIALYYSSSQYVNFLKAILDAEKIPYCVASGNSTKELHLTQFFLSLLDSAKKDFSYELLEKVVRNRVITFNNVLKKREVEEEDREEDDTTDAGPGEMTESEREEMVSDLSESLDKEEKSHSDSVWVNPIRGYRRALSAGIGWGRERYLAYYERVKEDSEADEGTKVFAGFLRDFVSVFDDDLSIGEIYRKLWDFVQLYTYSRNPEKAVLNNALREKWNEMMLIDSTGYTLQKKISFIRDMLENMKVEDGTDKGEAVCIFPMKDLFVMERKHNFLLGLSSSSFSANYKQSPLLLDEEKRKYLKGAGEKDSPVEIASQNFERLSENVKNSLRTATQDADVTVSYSYYDSIELRDDSPSVLFIELSDGKNIERASGYEAASYIQKQDIRLSTEDIIESVKERADKIEEERKEKRKKTEMVQDEKSGEKDNEKESSDPGKEVFSMSASGIQTFLACPLKYYYQYIRYLRIDEQMIPKGHEWLDFRNKGNICHYTMENYMSEAKDPAAGIDMELFDSAYQKALENVE
ncbi:MAG: PD-(D/E)XK nuclease family protein, partial [Lachnospiraceae bacterium]|nr:PD-(D/E)XK nuclease family protein [Lachnospiraceae bacterium]